MIGDLLEELKDIIKDFIKNFFSKFKYMLIIIILILLLISIIKLEQINPEKIENQQIKVFGITLENLGQWITIIALPYTAGWAIYQFRKSRAEKRQEKAAEIVKEFSNTIVEELNIIDRVYSSSILLNYMPLEEEKVKNFKYFNVGEIRKIYNNDEYVDIYKKKRSDFKEQLDNLYHIYLYFETISYSEINNKKEILKKILSNSLDEKEKKIIESQIKQFYGKEFPYHFIHLQNKVLNKLEGICMNISSKAADSDFIYQSVHQIFLRTVRLLYLEISILNVDSTDKFYTNIIDVYNKWMKIYLINKKKENKRIKKSNLDLNPKIKTV